MKAKSTVLAVAVALALLQAASIIAQANRSNLATVSLMRSAIAAQAMNPTCLSKMPTVDRVKREIQGKDAIDTAARNELCREKVTGADLLPLSKAPHSGAFVPAIIAREGMKTAKRFLEFFTAKIRNKKTRLTYARAIARFLNWCDERDAALTEIEPKEERRKPSSKTS